MSAFRRASSPSSASSSACPRRWSMRSSARAWAAISTSSAGASRSLGIPAEPYTIHSNGGLMSVETARDCPGPNLRVRARPPASWERRRSAFVAGLPDLITFDVGGTSTDVSLIDAGMPLFTAQPACRGLSGQDPDDRHPRHRRGRRLDRARWTTPARSRSARASRRRDRRAPSPTASADARRRSPTPISAWAGSIRTPCSAGACMSIWTPRRRGDRRNSRASRSAFRWKPPRMASSRSPTPT